VSDAIYARDLYIYEKDPFRKLIPESPDDGPAVSLASIIQKLPPKYLTVYLSRFASALTQYVEELNEVKIQFLLDGGKIEVPIKGPAQSGVGLRQITFDIVNSRSFVD
jgi:hypothetical protein